MSHWYVNDQWPSFFAFDDGPVTLVDCTDATITLSLDARDVLSEPGVDDLLPAGLALWPRGPAFGSPDGEAIPFGTVWARLTQAMLKPLADLYARAWQLTNESRASSLIDSLEDWEADLGLPDPCVTSAQSVEQRKASVRSKASGVATITPQEFVKLAARLGFIVALEEPFAFRVGESSVGWGGDELSNVGLEQQWVLHVFDMPVWQFEVGVSEVGVDRLLDFDLGPLECVVRRIRPGWTEVVFSIAPLPQGFLLTDDDDVPLADDDGLPFLAFA